MQAQFVEDSYNLILSASILGLLKEISQFNTRNNIPEKQQVIE